MKSELSCRHGGILFFFNNGYTFTTSIALTYFFSPGRSPAPGMIAASCSSSFLSRCSL